MFRFDCVLSLELDLFSATYENVGFKIIKKVGTLNWTPYIFDNVKEKELELKVWLKSDLFESF